MAKKATADIVNPQDIAANQASAAKTDGSPSKNKYGGERRWSVPSKRAKGYAEERRAKVHKWGEKEGKQLTDYESGIRSGYLQAQSDHAGLYKYKKALEEGKSKAEAVKISRQRGNKAA